MSENPYNAPYSNPFTVAQAEESERSAFIRRTYWHLAGAIGIFALLEAMLMSIPGIEDTVFGLLGASPYSWLVVLGLFMGGSWFAQKWATNGGSQTTQYSGLGLYVCLEAVIFLPLLLMARTFADNIIFEAAAVTFFLFAGLTTVAFTTRKDFSFLGGILKVAGFIALGVIVVSIFAGFSLGLLFSGIMVLFAGGCILYSTSNIIHKYQTDQHVAASLDLFASVALLFWYVLRIFMSFRD